MNVLLICDRPNWAYDSIAHALKKYNHNHLLKLDIFYLKNKEEQLKVFAREHKYDLYFFLGWQLLSETSSGLFGKTKYKYRYPFIDTQKVITGIHSHHAWDGRKTLPDNSVPPPENLINFLSQFRGVNAVSYRLFSLFKDHGLKNCHYTPNGVDIEIFFPFKPFSTDKLRIGFSGNKKHDWRKGITQYIEPLSTLPWVELKLAMPQEDYVPLNKMPHFYNDIDLYLCASSSEGFSLSVLEASACGRPVVTTRVGGCEELIIDGENGFFVDRSIEDIKQKVSTLYKDKGLIQKMGTKNRQIVEEKWSWELRVHDWLKFITKNI
jgi:glycosyltransferase involved in cell wall biosynthesis